MTSCLRLALPLLLLAACGDPPDEIRVLGAARTGAQVGETLRFEYELVVLTRRVSAPEVGVFGGRLTDEGRRRRDALERALLEDWVEPWSCQDDDADCISSNHLLLWVDGEILQPEATPGSASRPMWDWADGLMTALRTCTATADVIPDCAPPAAAAAR